MFTIWYVNFDYVKIIQKQLVVTIQTEKYASNSTRNLITRIDALKTK